VGARLQAALGGAPVRALAAGAAAWLAVQLSARVVLPAQVGRAWPGAARLRALDTVAAGLTARQPVLGRAAADEVAALLSRTGPPLARL
jgi:hypothetical protein